MNEKSYNHKHFIIMITIIITFIIIILITIIILLSISFLYVLSSLDPTSFTPAPSSLQQIP